MTRDAAVRAFLLARLGTGAVYAAAPGPAVRGWLAAPPGTVDEVPLRAMGARDVALSLGGLAASDPRPWLRAAAVAEAADALAVLLVARRLPRRQAVVAVVGPALLAALAYVLVGRSGS